jgi:hypothetical protein
MLRIPIDVEPTPEVVVQVRWRQWEDGRWEAWLVDESGLPPQRAQDRWELQRFLEQACRNGQITGCEHDGAEA